MNFKTFKKGVVLGVAVLAICALSLPVAFAQPVPGGTLNPLTIPKYVEPLVIPPALYDDVGAPMTVEVALRQFNQQILPTTGCTAASLANVAAGLPAIVCNGDQFPLTTLWGYGDPTAPGTFFNPSFTIEVTKDTQTTVKWINQLTEIPGDNTSNFLPHIIQDAAGTPIIDQTLHWAAPNQDCLDGNPRTDCRGASDQPYLGPIPMVTHVHGAHVGPGSDGYPEAWWLPATVTIPAGYAKSGTYFESADGSLGNDGWAVDVYPNDQPTTTLWYHDHSLGITRLNVYAAAAGFWLIRDANDGETGLNQGTLPGPAPGRWNDVNAPAPAAIREIPIAIQPKSFYADGRQFYPANRAFFEGLGNGSVYNANFNPPVPGLDIPFLPTGTSDISPVWNPEAFFNTMVVNGRTWPQLDVAPALYRLRFVNASDSRFMNLSLKIIQQTVRRNGTVRERVVGELPFYQIGAEQSLLPQVVQVLTGFSTPIVPGNLPTNRTRVRADSRDRALLLGPAERPDVIVDFRGLPNGTIVRMINTGPDAPFGGFPDVPADPATTGQVMQFVVNTNTPGDVPAGPNGAGATDPMIWDGTALVPNLNAATDPWNLFLDPNAGGDAPLGVAPVTRDLALLEEESALICVTVDPAGNIVAVPGAVPPLCAALGPPGQNLGGVPFAPKAAVLGNNGSAGPIGVAGPGTGSQVTLWSDPIVTNPQNNAIETWELWNWSADAHPIHPHLVKFSVENRQVIGGAVRPPEPTEAGWKDTVIAYPGEVTRVKALFDIKGLYVWHCHILSHEDNEMMVPYCVGQAGVDCPAELF